MTPEEKTWRMRYMFFRSELEVLAREWQAEADTIQSGVWKRTRNFYAAELKKKIAETHKLCEELSYEEVV